MAEQLQHLIDRIRTEAVDKGETEASQLVAKAQEKANAIVHEAEEKARAIIHKADQDAKQYTERSKQALQQASRDLLIAVGKRVEGVMKELTVENLDQALTPDFLRDLIIKMAEAYASGGGDASAMEVRVSPDDHARLESFFRGEYTGKLKSGLTLVPDRTIPAGFTFKLEGGHVRHDFTREAIAEALSQFVRPKLAEIIHQAATGRNGKDGDAAS